MAEGMSTPRQHYDAATDIVLEHGAWQEALVHTMLGVLSGLIEMNTTLDQLNSRYQEASRIR
jgi:hypothetical protein